jgi:hypothetical protein
MLGEEKQKTLVALEYLERFREAQKRQTLKKKYYQL